MQKKRIFSFILTICIMLSLYVIPQLSSCQRLTPQQIASQSTDIERAIPTPTDEEVLVQPPAAIQPYEYRPAYDLGTCRNLKGNPLVVLLFLDDDESHWTAREIKQITDDDITKGLQFIENEAERRGTELDFSVISYSTPFSGYTLRYEGSVIRDLTVSGSSKDVLEQAAHDLGFSSNWAMYSKFKTDHNKQGNTDNDVIFLTFLNKRGRSYTRNTIKSTDEHYYTEHCVIFSKRLTLFEYNRVDHTVAHELMHLFGAEDFYHDYRISLAEKYYPKDIMLTYSQDFHKSEISDLTAYSVGWIDIAPELCYNKEWWE